MSKRIIIVGAGMAGLSAGCYARMNGYDCQVFEKHSIPGGLCTAWEKNGYKFDTSMHMLTASASGPLHRMWEELGIARNFKFHYHDHAGQIEGMGKTLRFTTDRKELEEQMLSISPADKKNIHEFTSLIFGPDMMNAASLKTKESRNIFDNLKMGIAILPLIRPFMKYRKMTIQEFAARFKDPFLRQAVRFFIDGPGWPMPDFPMVALAGMVKGGITGAGTPLGGSQQVAFHLARFFGDLGGTFHYKSEVADLVIDNDNVKGIRLKDGSEHHADLVIWAGDGHNLLSNILGGRYMSDRIQNMYDNWMPVKPIVHVMMGVNMDLSDEPFAIILEPGEKITIAGREHSWLLVRHHCFDKSMAPEGKSEVEVWYDTEYDYWADLRKDRAAYKAEKKRIADYTIRQLDERWPGFASKVEVVDVPTPATYYRYTSNWKGSPDGWYITSDNMNQMEPVRSLPGLKNFYMAGQWTAPFTGTVIAALSGRQVVETICREEGKKMGA
ncbi:MAG TPA: NAD(P)/FAD-dependent oxidoreductase [Bacteroidales bacterium]|nr:NAD(P)/FAD-dependent oxidoreductase [Bacteroidales bacterium]